jgi:tungstate transport system substrate-binding protein
MRATLGALIIGAALLGAGCRSTPTRSITLATTTTIRDSGLLDDLLGAFQLRSGIEVRAVAVGTGQALEIGRRGDADVIFTHDPAGEERFVAEGFGTARIEVMSNDFVLVGPPDDPAGVGIAQSGIDAFRIVHDEEAVFISRGDESGTHQKEKATWVAAGIVPTGNWYVLSGQGMGAVLRMADEKRGYTLSDRGTFMAQREKLNLTVLYSGDPAWINRYAVIPVSPVKHPHLKHDPANQFAEFLVSEETQRLIADYGRDKYGEPLFRPNPRATGGSP